MHSVPHVPRHSCFCKQRRLWGHRASAETNDNASISQADESLEYSDSESESDYLWKHDDVDCNAALKEAKFCALEYAPDLDDSVSTTVPSDDESLTYHTFDTTADIEYDSTYNVIAANVRAQLPADYEVNEEFDYVEFYFEGPAHKLCF